ncbi:MAG TPA: hypothetical protein DCM86_04980 [Verrucomicrobiales bacterium]|nr:hypothetical protein [Verrucomicrobiales bacterium]
MTEEPVHAEKLDLPQLPADVRQEMEALVDVLTRVRKVGPHHQDPPVHRGGNEELVIESAMQPLLPGTGAWVPDVEDLLNDGCIHPADRKPPERGVEHRLPEVPVGHPPRLGIPATPDHVPCHLGMPVDQNHENQTDKQDREDAEDEQRNGKIALRGRRAFKGREHLKQTRHAILGEYRVGGFGQSKRGGRGTQRSQ